MKKILLFAVLSVLGMTQMAAQEYEYVPFVREGVKWVYSITDYHYEAEHDINPAFGDNKVYRTFEMKGDTVINGKTYKAVHKYSGDAIDEENDTILVFLREEDKMVYAIVPDGGFYDDGLVETYLYYGKAIPAGQEFVLYDFQDPATYWGLSEMFNLLHLDLHEGTVLVGNHLAKCYSTEDNGGNDYFRVIEGIGAMGMNSYPLAFFMPTSPGIHTTEYYNLEKVVENGEVIYPQNYDEDRYSPVIREGVKWINEKVIVDNGEETRYYYAYEFKGNSPFQNGYGQVFKALYYSDCTPEAITDSLIAGLREGEGLVVSHRNHALNSVIEQDRNMVTFYNYQNSDGTRLLYDLNTYNSEPPFAIDFFIDAQREQFLTAENFVMVDPIEIDGVKCARCAYVDEQGNPLAYVVEGIGFDSYDMGDLLTPFTRKPDPDADHQEYWGLSHVVKDGKIIYKGMRYNADLFEGVKGDVNGDGVATIVDVTDLIDYLLGATDRSINHIAADVNGNNEITISDVTALIDLLLTQ